MKQYYQFSFFVPPAKASLVRNAVLEAGAGRLGHYTHCCWETQGRGQFMIPGADNQPGTTRTFDEIKMEVIVAEDRLQDVVEALVKHHPSEHPNYYCTAVDGLSCPPDDDND